MTFVRAWLRERHCPRRTAAVRIPAVVPQRCRTPDTPQRPVPPTPDTPAAGNGPAVGDQPSQEADGEPQPPRVSTAAVAAVYSSALVTGDGSAQAGGRRLSGCPAVGRRGQRTRLPDTGSPQARGALDTRHCGSAARTLRQRSRWTAGSGIVRGSPASDTACPAGTRSPGAAAARRRRPVAPPTAARNRRALCPRSSAIQACGRTRRLQRAARASTSPLGCPGRLEPPTCCLQDSPWSSLRGGPSGLKIGVVAR